MFKVIDLIGYTIIEFSILHLYIYIKNNVVGIQIVFPFFYFMLVILPKFALNAVHRIRKL